MRRALCALALVLVFEFTLRIVRKDDRPGSVSVSAVLTGSSGSSGTDRVTDPYLPNDDAPVRVRVTGPAPPAPGPGTTVWVAGITGAMAVAGAVLFAVRRRRADRRKAVNGVTGPRGGG